MRRCVLWVSLLVLALEYEIGYSSLIDSPFFDQLPQELCQAEMLTLLFVYEGEVMERICPICHIRIAPFASNTRVHEGKIVHTNCKAKAIAKAEKDKVVVHFGKISRTYLLQ